MNEQRPGGAEPPSAGDLQDPVTDARRDRSDTGDPAVRIFPEVLDRQVADRRAIHRLVEVATERLATIETSIRDVREVTGTQSVALRAEVQDAIERLERRVDDAVARLDARLDAVTVAWRGDVGRLGADHVDAVASLRDRIADRLDLLEATITEQAPDAASVRTQLAATRDATESAIRAVSAALEGMTRQVASTGTSIDDRLGAAASSIDDRLGAAASSIDDRLAALSDRVDARLADLDATGAALPAQVAAGIDRAVEAAARSATSATDTLAAAASRLDEVFAGLGDLEMSLVSYLEARDVRLEQERARILGELIDRFVDDLSRRQRKRLGRSLETASQAAVPPPPLAPVPDADPAHRPGALRDALADGPPTPPAAPEARDEPARIIDLDAPAPASGQTSGQTSGPASGVASGVVVPVFREDDTAEIARPDVAPAPRASATATVDGGFPCPECGFTARNRGGLASHRRVHR